MKGFYIEVTNNLLDPKHLKAIDTSLWEFLWCLDKITLIDETEIGWVYNKSPINLKDIEKEIGRSKVQISRNLNRLEKNKYLILIHTQRGIIIGINKAKKRFNRNVKPSKKRFIIDDKPGLSPMINQDFMHDKPEGGIYNSININNKHINADLKESASNKNFKKIKRTDFIISQDIYKKVTDAYQELKGITLNGPEFGEVKRAIKTMLYSERSVDDIISFMRFCKEVCDRISEGDENTLKTLGWLENWTILTIKRKLPEFLANKFKKVDEELIIPSYARNYGTNN